MRPRHLWSARDGHPRHDATTTEARAILPSTACVAACAVRVLSMPGVEKTAVNVAAIPGMEVRYAGIVAAAAGVSAGGCEAAGTRDGPLT